MQKFILLRGHEGSGKSTFAAEKIAQFHYYYPNATIVLIDNDQDLIDKNGIYHFDFDKFSFLHRRNIERQQAAFEAGKRKPQHNILVINANPNQKAKACYAHIAQARLHHFSVEIYRLHNFFANVHGVPEEDVLRSYVRLNANPVRGEIHVAPIKIMSAVQARLLNNLLDE